MSSQEQASLQEFYFYSNLDKICSELNPYVDTETFCEYIKSCFDKSIPIVLYCDNHVEIALKLIKCHLETRVMEEVQKDKVGEEEQEEKKGEEELYGWPSEKEKKINVKQQSNVEICCKHYPFTCDEVLNDINIQAIYGSHFRKDSCCDCTGKCYCDEGTPVSHHFWRFSWRDKYMKHKDNCYEDCCSHSLVFKRFVIETKQWC